PARPPPVRWVRGRWASECGSGPRGSRTSSCRRARLPAEPPLLACGLQLAIALSPDRGSLPRHERQRGDVAERAMQSHAIIVIDEPGHEAPRLLECRRLGRAQRVALQGLVPPLDLPI